MGDDSLSGETSELRVDVPGVDGGVSALLCRPQDARWLYVFAHGAGAGMSHAFMESATRALAERGVATLRYQFAYMERGSRRPDGRALLFATVRAAVEGARNAAPDLPLLAGGKSMGGRMTSLAASEAPLPGVRGIAFVGFPLHPAGRPSTERADHLFSLTTPMLFMQGTRDKLAELELLEPICAKLGDAARLSIVEGADHGFHVLKRSGRTDDDVLDELARTLAKFAQEIA